MKRWLLAGALAFAAAGQGLASDLPPPAVPAPPRTPAAYVPPVSPVYNWAGIYFGFNLGYGFGTSNWSDPLDPGGTTGNFNLRSFLSGATIEVNFQTDSFVYGAEADFDGSFIDGKTSSPFCSTGTQCETKNFRFSTLRARLGYAADRVLFYGTAGGALGDVNFQRTTKGGWTAGGSEIFAPGFVRPPPPQTEFAPEKRRGREKDLQNFKSQNFCEIPNADPEPPVRSALRYRRGMGHPRDRRPSLQQPTTSCASG